MSTNARMGPNWIWEYLTRHGRSLDEALSDLGEEADNGGNGEGEAATTAGPVHGDDA